MDRFEEMRTFVRVVEAGSLSAAADRLDIAKSAVSRRLAELESRLGVQLLNRTTRRLNLTDSGSIFYQRCLRILADLEESEQYVSSEHTNLRGTIRIAAPLTFGVHHLSPLLNDFLKEHPELSLDLDLNDRNINLMDEGVDLGIRIGKLQDSTMMARKLASARMLLCASPEYLQQHGEPQSPEDLKEHFGLSYSNISEGHLWQFTHEDGKSYSVHVPFRMRANNGEVLHKAALDGLGIVATVSFICYRELEQGRLKQILSDYKTEEVGIYAIYPSQRHLPGRVRLLIDYLAERFGDEPYWDKCILRKNR
ncbi:MAG: LysR family transcriptional regulator [Gammaproteobacteria bacterium]|nr:LysR family transcriptional regulator [Gammaproteobacteria bacterium]